MRVRALCLATAALVVGLAVPVSTPTARAVNACGGTGVMTTSFPLWYPVAPPLGGPPYVATVPNPSTAAFALSMVFGQSTCAPETNKTLGATGVLNGWCGHIAGAGTTTSGSSFALVGIGNMLVVTGDLAGLGTWVQNPMTSDNCNHGADGFLLALALVDDACPLTVTKTTTTTPAPTVSTTVVADPFVVGVNSRPMTYHVKRCV